MRESDWDFVLDINLKAGCFAAIAVAKALIAAKKAGSIINLASQRRCAVPFVVCTTARARAASCP